MEKHVAPNGGVGFSGLLTIAFIVLKLVGVIDWSWWWVISPPIIASVVRTILIKLLDITEKKLNSM